MTSLASSQVTGPHWIPVIFRRTGRGSQDARVRVS
jgi:hypothetical protein